MPKASRDRSLGTFGNKIMPSSKITIAVLVTLLICSNAWWAYQLFDRTVTMTYTTVSLEDNKQALDQSLFLIPMLTTGHTSRETIIPAMEKHFNLANGFQKDGLYFIGSVGLRFNEGGKLVAVERAWK